MTDEIMRDETARDETAREADKGKVPQPSIEQRLLDAGWKPVMWLDPYDSGPDGKPWQWNTTGAQLKQQRIEKDMAQNDAKDNDNVD